MEDERGPRAEARLNPTVVRRIVKYFQIAGESDKDSLAAENPNNPIRQISGEQQVTQEEYDSFLQKLSSGNLSRFKKTFFRDIAGKFSPAAYPDDQRIESLHRILTNPTLNFILNNFKTGLFSDEKPTLDPEKIERAKQEVIRVARDAGGQRVKEVEAKMDEFLRLNFGPALEYSEQFQVLQSLAEQKYPKQHSEPRFKRRPSYDYTHSERRYSPPPPPPNYEAPPKRDVDLDPKGYYSTLGLDPIQTQELTEEQFALALKRAYRKAALKSHPDIGGDTKKIAAINNAREFLKDPLKRRNYGS